MLNHANIKLLQGATWLLFNSSMAIWKQCFKNIFKFLSVTCCYSSGQTGGVCKKRFIWQKPGPRNLQYTDNTAEHLPFTSQGSLYRDHIASMNSKQGTVCLTYVRKNARKRAGGIKELFDTKRQTETDRHGAYGAKKRWVKSAGAGCSLVERVVTGLTFRETLSCFLTLRLLYCFYGAAMDPFYIQIRICSTTVFCWLSNFFQLERFLKSH